MILVVAFSACGKKSETKPKDAAPEKPPVAPIAIPTLGVDHVTRFNFGWGISAWEKAQSLAKAKGAKDWAAIKTQCEATLAKDPQHLDAHRLLATALVQTGDPAGAVDHLVTAIAADYYKYGPGLAADEDLKGFLATSHGQSVAWLAEEVKREFGKRAASGLWLVARRTKYTWPKDPGVQTSTSRGELYAYDRETKRFYRLTHTDHQVAGFVRAPSGEVAVLGFDKIDKPKEDANAPLVARAWVQVFDPVEWKSAGPKATLGPAREVGLGYGAGEQLLVTTAAANGRWGAAAPVVSSIDKTSGKLTKVTTAAPVPRIVFSIEEGNLIRAPEGTEAAWSGDPPVTTSFKTAAGGTVQVPESGQAGQSSLAVAPGGARVAFATAVDPCAKDAAPSLYVADAKTGALKHVLTAKSRFSTRWLDGNIVAYEDGDGAIRLWDATTGREAMRLDDRGGLALDVLSLAPAPLCKQAPPVADTGSGSGDEMPPEEAPPSGSGGPVTAPQ